MMVRLEGSEYLLSKVFSIVINFGLSTIEIDLPSDAMKSSTASVRSLCSRDLTVYGVLDSRALAIVGCLLEPLPDLRLSIVD